ncbi:hypothetical protein CEUSTIGMA_g11622.t1 [Chlamydomonas eustigma]|uniref:Ketopantoate reductase C-terminal domain-containing protein n=1 Tax=Chlamydomonas eustigma TaxID=1157962 RepID=A0A250XMP7_9CHLO|nr:hypothetical protein CEUSTIGMA_g11622.t1 [Chlamydomonas eustigma]|eukprot:GAX84199.1 hypothetical protein CEUSTIGMA_g11622.t1 [Chlamydomonas eustigma]
MFFSRALERISSQASIKKTSVFFDKHRMRGACDAASTSKAITIVGGGRVGLALQEMAPLSVVIRRGEPIEGPSGPILICTRNDDLQGIVDATPVDRRKDLVFLQNGMLQPWLDSKDLGGNTQVLVYFAVAKKGEKPTDGKTDVNPEGLTAACGPHAQVVAELLHSGGLSCKVLDRIPFTRAMLEKLIWISAFMLVGSKHKATIGEVEAKHREEVSSLIRELAAAGQQELGVELDEGYVERLLAYARSVAHFPTAVKEFPWRNGWFYNISKKQAGQGLPDPMPTHSRLLEEVKAV